MRELRHSLHLFVEALHQGLPIFLTPQGYWKAGNSFEKTIGSLLWSKVSANKRLVESFNSILDHLESLPVNFSHMHGVIVSQPVDFHGYLSAAQSLQRFVQKDNYPVLNPLLNLLKVKTLGLLYRLEEENGGLRLSEGNPTLMERTVNEAMLWKKKEKIFWKTELSDGEQNEITNAIKYVEFIKQLLVDTKLKDDFFAWVLRDGLPANVFIQFPALTEKLTLSHLRGRLGRMGKGYLRLRKVDGAEGAVCQQKIVTLPFEGRDISLLNEKQEVVFRGNYKVTIKQIFHVFRNKKRDLGNFEVFAQGILNWNSNCMGWWNNDLRAYELIDLENPCWWRQLPILEALSIEEASTRFKVDLDGRKWVLAAKSAREFTTLNYDESHAYVEMAIPSSDNQYYIIYTFGKAAIELPRNSWHRLFLFGAHVPATVVYPDETMYFTHRQQIGYIFELSEDDGLRLMDAFREDIQHARSGNMVFQIEAENCGKWIQNHLEEHLGAERVPNLYRFPLLEAEPNGFMAKFFGFFKSLPRFCRNYMFVLIHYPLGAWRGRWVIDKQGQKVWKSLTNSSFWKDTITYLPAYLHKQHETGVFAEDPVRHKIWVEASPVVQSKIKEPAGESTILFNEDNK